MTASQFPRCAGRWLRLLLLMCGDIEPNPCPRQQGPKIKIPRGDLDMSIRFAPTTSRRMSSCLLFETWLRSSLHISLDQIGWDTLAAPLAARAYGMHLYCQGEPRYLYVYSLAGLQDDYLHLRAFMALAWVIYRKWQVAASHASLDESFK